MAENRAKPLRILYLEDNSSDAVLVQRELDKAGLRFMVERVETREDFARTLDDCAPDIILADYHLPSFDGLAALALAREQCPDVPFVFVTGVLGDERAVEALRQGADDYILKDRMSRLGPAVLHALEDARLRKERAAAEQALQQSEIRYRRLFEAARDGILFLNEATGQIEGVNPYLVEMLGYAESEFLDKKIWEIGAFTDVALSKRLFAELQERGEVRYDDLPLQAKDGRLIEAEFVSNIYSSGDHKVIQCNIRNITARKLAEAKLREQLEELQRFERVAIGREQRIQELKEENERLRARLTEPERVNPVKKF